MLRRPTSIIIIHILCELKIIIEGIRKAAFYEIMCIQNFLQINIYSHRILIFLKFCKDQSPNALFYSVIILFIVLCIWDHICAPYINIDSNKPKYIVRRVDFDT